LRAHQLGRQHRHVAGSTAEVEHTADLIAHYPPSVKKWINRHGGLTLNMKRVKNGPDLWAILDPCPDEF
jgi:hypothetical protein